MAAPRCMHNDAAHAPNYPALTGLRGAAAVWVALHHAWQAAGSPALKVWILDPTPLLACGYFGVDLFFVLSGFLLGAPFLDARVAGRPTPSLRSFWYRRTRRVMPAFLAQVAILSLLALSTSGSLPLTPAQYPVYGLLLFNLQEGFPLLNPVHWSLPVEWNFYLVLPLLALCFPARGDWRHPLALALLFALGFRAACWYALERHGAEGLPLYRWILQLPARIDQFVFGMAAARFIARRPLTSLPRWLGIAALPTLAWLIWNAAPRGDIFGKADWPWILWHYSALGAALALLIAHACNPVTMVARALGSRPMIALGLVSYSLYLWHFPLLEWLAVLLPALRPGAWNWWLSYAVTLLTLSGTSYALFEKPFHHRLRRGSQAAGSGGGKAACAEPQ